MEEKTLYTPKEASDILGLDRDLLRKYCEYFNIQTEWTKPDGSGHRRYTKENIEQLLEVKRLIQDEKLTWDQVRSFLNGEEDVFLETKTKTQLEKKVDLLIEHSQEEKDFRQREEQFFQVLLQKIDSLENQNKQLISENQELKEELKSRGDRDQLVLQYLEGKQEEKQEDNKSFFKKLFGR